MVRRLGLEGQGRFLSIGLRIIRSRKQCLAPLRAVGRGSYWSPLCSVVVVYEQAVATKPSSDEYL